MKSLKIYVIVLFAICFGLVSCTSSDSENGQKADLKSSMHRFAATISNLIPYMGQLYKFEDQKNQKIILANLQELKTTNALISHQLEKSYSDPAMLTVIEQFNDDINAITDDYQMEKYLRANWRLRHIISNCNTCHSRSSEDFKLKPIRWDVKTEGLRPEESIEILLALKMYREAIDKLFRAMDLNQITGYPLKQTLKKSLAVSVRVLRNYDLSSNIVNHAMKTGNQSLFQRGLLKFWKKSLTNIKNNPATAQAFYEKGLKAEKRGKDYGFVFFLEGSARVNKDLNKYSSDYRYSKSLLLAGQLSTKLVSISEGEQDIAFFESCILHRPHSSFARKCYKYLKSSYQRRGFLKKSAYKKRLDRFWVEASDREEPLHEKMRDKKELDDEFIFLRRIYLDDLSL